MKGWIGSDVLALVIVIFTMSLLSSPELLNLVAFLTIYPALIAVLITNLFNIFSRISGKGTSHFQKFNGTTSVLVFIGIIGLLFGKIIAPSGPWDDFSFGYFTLLSFVILYLFVNSAFKTCVTLFAEHSGFGSMQILPIFKCFAAVASIKANCPPPKIPNLN